MTSDGIITTVAGNCTQRYDGDGGLGSTTSVCLPNAVAVDNQRNLYIADSANHRIRKVTQEGIVSTVVGDGKSGFSGDGGPATAARLGYPGSLAMDASGEPDRT